VKKISLFEPNVGNLEKKLVVKSINENQISSYGYFTNLFEKEVKKITLSKYNLATSSGSSALFVALKSIGIKRDEIVLTQSYTFTGTTNAIILNNSIPLLLDIKKDNLNLDLDNLENFLDKNTLKKGKFIYHKILKKKITCLCLVFTLGIIPDLMRAKKISRKYNLKIVFDAACALGQKYLKKKLTDYCDVAIYSLNGSKNITSGAGGVISTEKFKYYDFAFKFSNNGKILNAYDYKMIGFNLKMSSLNAAVGLGQLKRFNYFLKKKRIIKNNYSKQLHPMQLFNTKYDWGDYLPWLNFCVLNDKKKRDYIIKALRNNNIMVSKFWLPMHMQTTKKHFLLTKCPNTKYIYDRILVLPSSTFLNLKSIKRISSIIKKNYFNK
jgi:perosamine synthetase